VSIIDRTCKHVVADAGRKLQLSSSLLCLLLLVSCPLAKLGGADVVLLYNTTNSNRSNLDPDKLFPAINVVLSNLQFRHLSVYVVAEEPVDPLHYKQARDASPQQIVDYFENIRDQQLVRREAAREAANQAATGNSKSQAANFPELRDRWGSGTDHARVLRRVNQHRKQGEPLVLVLITDGFNEGYPWSEVETALQELYANGPTRLFLMGVANDLVSYSGEKVTVQEKWTAALQAAGASDLRHDSKLAKGYLTSGALVPDKDKLKAAFP
jgi:hypothetical protein